MAKVRQTHQIYGPSATRVACGREITTNTRTVLPGKASCKVCQKVEAARKREAKNRKAAIAGLV